MAGADLFDAYFRRADLDRDGRITGPEAVAFFRGANLPQQVLAQIWTYADQQKTGFLGRNEFYNALKLVTVAQSKRELTPDIVKAALFGPASAKIPAPQINMAATPAPPSNPTARPPAPQLGPTTSTPSQSMGVRAPQAPTNLNMGQQFFPSQVNQMGRPSRPAPPPVFSNPQQGVPASHSLSTGISSSWGGTPTPLAGQTTAVATRAITPSTTSLDTSSAQSGPQVTTGLMQSPPKVEAQDSKSPAISGNGFASGFGDGFSVTAPPKQDTVSSFPASGFSASSATVPASTRAQTTVRPYTLGSTPVPPAQQLTGNQHQQTQSTMKGIQQVPGQNLSSPSYGFAAGPESQVSWPRMSPADVQKYNKVFIEVDSDRDGKITGEQARNLFISWRLPREILRQVWDLSDQDNDSMLSLREFCIALYLMERHREGRPLPRTLPDSIMIDEALSSASGRQSAAYGNTAWRPPPGLQQSQVTPAGRPPVARRQRPPAQARLPLEEVMQPAPQRSKVPVLEKHLVNQLSEQEQNSLNTKFNEATEANKKVEELEKEILDSRKKIEYFQTKMQELILYKSRCDNRLNEITERTSMDKREVESLGKKYEEKYKQSGDVASKLSIEEATFRDIQEKKMDLYRSIIKMEQDGKPESIQVNANKIQTELEELMKSVNERCKTYGLRGKPTTLVELPFGWQPGLQEGAADWDENWDKFEDEGYTFVKELTLDVQNVIAPPKVKSSVQSKVSTKEGIQDASLTNGDHKTDTTPSEGEVKTSDTEDGVAKSSVASPAHVSMSPSEKLKSDPAEKELTADGSPHALETQSEREGGESVFSGDKIFNEPRVGTFDSHDSDSAWNFGSTKDFDMGNSFFDSGDLGLPPIRIGSSDQRKSAPVFDSVPSTPQTDNLFQNKSSYTFDSVPSTPQTDNLFQNKSSYTFDSVPSTPQTTNLFAERSTFAFDSVPSTPVSDNLFQSKSAFAFDSIPNTPQADYLYQQKSAFAFDSVPSTPSYNYNSNSPRRLSEGSELNSFDSFSRFDSFNAHDSGLFPARESLSRFDSFNSTRESDYGQGFSSQDAFSRYDSFGGNTKDPAQDNFSRFDSFKSTTKDSPQEAYSRYDSFRSTTKDSDSGTFPSKDYARFDSFSDGDHGHSFNTFDDSDPFRSTGPFKTSFDSQTPRKDSDNWKAF